MTDHELLAQYLRTGSEDAFGELVRRHTDMVYATCLRVLRDPHQAEDAAQAAFLVLVKRGSSIGRGDGIAGWLYRVALNAARNTQRMAARRARHEQRAAVAAEVSVSRLADGASEPDLRALAAELDRALQRLPAVQRDAIVLRCLQGRTQAEAAAEQRCPPETLHTRFHRGLAKLRTLLSRKDVRLSAAALLLLLEKSAQQLAPAPLASSIQAACLGKAAASVSATTVALEVSKNMAWIKFTTTAACAAAIGLACCLVFWRASLSTTKPVALSPAPQIAPAPDNPITAPVAAPQPVVEAPVAQPVKAQAAADSRAEAQRLGKAIDSGLAWLAKSQETDGRFDSQKHGGAADQDVAVTSIATLAMLGAGHTERVGAYKGTVAKSIHWLQQQRPQEITQAALRVVVLAENYGMSLRGQADAQAAVDDLVARQDLTGQWLDENGKGEYASRVSPTTWALIALKSAHVAHLTVPHATFDAAIKSFDVQQRDVLTNEDNLEGAKMAAGLAVQRQFLGDKRESASLQELIRILPKYKPAFPSDGIGQEVVQWWQGSLAFFQQGGEGWNDWCAALKDALLPAQVNDGDLAGSWDFRQGSDPFQWGRVGSTALAALPLEVEMRYLYLAVPERNTVKFKAELPSPSKNSDGF